MAHAQQQRAPRPTTVISQNARYMDVAKKNKQILAFQNYLMIN